MKKCRKCKRLLNDFKYYKHPFNKDGLNNQCKECQIKYDRKWKKNNPDKVKVINRRWGRRNNNWRDAQRRHRKKIILYRVRSGSFYQTVGGEWLPKTKRFKVGDSIKTFEDNLSMRWEILETEVITIQKIEKLNMWTITWLEFLKTKKKFSKNYLYPNGIVKARYKKTGKTKIEYHKQFNAIDIKDAKTFVKDKRGNIKKFVCINNDNSKERFTEKDL